MLRLNNLKSRASVFYDNVGKDSSSLECSLSPIYLGLIHLRHEGRDRSSAVSQMAPGDTSLLIKVFH